mmetsp:Transcript_6067/g.22941  ORF Transcript_6067/g.22941 Transcript_6067/m.22941 type:complete len:106 (-) Transcript_6067:266-583(-)
MRQTPNFRERCATSPVSFHCTTISSPLSNKTTYALSFSPNLLDASLHIDPFRCKNTVLRNETLNIGEKKNPRPNKDRIVPNELNIHAYNMKDNSRQRKTLPYMPL